MGSGLNPDQLDWNDVFLGAALEPYRWPEALDQLASHTGASHGELIGIGSARDIPFNIMTNLDPNTHQEFVDIGGGSPAINFRVAACQQGLTRGNYDGVLYEKHYDEAIPLLQSKIYLEFCDRKDLLFGCQTNLVVDRAGLIGLAILRTRKEGRTNAKQRRTFEAASIAARRAVRLQERLEGEQAILLAGAFEAIAATAFILDARGRVLAMTQGAEQIVAAGDITLNNKCLDARGTPLSLAQCVGALVTDNGLGHVRLRIDCPDSRPALFMEGFRLPKREWSLGYLPHAILVAKPPQRDRAGIAAFLVALYRMTPAEADIAMRLYEGKSRSEICEARTVTAETLRGQIKSIYAKTETENEAALMRLLAAIMA